MIQMTKKEAKLGREKPHLDCFDDSFAKFTVNRFKCQMYNLMLTNKCALKF